MTKPNNALFQAILKKVDATKDGKIAILFRKKNFLTNLPGFSSQPNTIMILLIAEKALPKLSDTTAAIFDFIVPFSLLDEEAKPTWRDLSTTDFAKPTQFLERLLKEASIPSSKVYLIANEEPTLYYASRMRTKFGLAGYGTEEMSRFLDKQQMKDFSRLHGISTAKAFLLDSTMKSTNASSAIAHSIKSNMSFPLFVKPRYGCALVGTRIVPSEKELCEWFEDTYAEPFTYLIEECLTGTEYAAYILIQNGDIVAQTMFKNVHPISDFVHKVRPLAKIQLSADDDLCPDYQLFKEFCYEVVQAFKPPNGIFGVQAIFQLGIFNLLETSSRLPGGLFTSLILQTTGISVETIHIMLQMNQAVDQTVRDNMNNGNYVAYIRYPRKAGKVKKLLSPSTSASVKNIKWYVHEGDEIENPRALAHRHEVVALELWNSDYKTLAEDFSVLVNEYSPLQLL